MRLWDAEIGDLQQTLEGHSSSALAVIFSPDGRRLASGSDDKTVRLWDAETGALQQTLKGHSDSVVAVTFSPDGRRLASGSNDKTVRLWDSHTGVLQQTLEVSSSVLAVTFSPNGRRLITNLGSIDLENRSSEFMKTTSLSSYSMDKDRTWITWKGHNVLWLPPEYRPTCHMFQDDVLAMGHSSGRVTVIRFKPDVSPLTE